MPPECDVCGRRPDPAEDGLDGFTTLTFADHEPLPDGMTGHPKGVHWLCSRHAEDLADHTHLPWDVARSRVRRFLANLPGHVEGGGTEADEGRPIEGLGRTGALDLEWRDGDGLCGVHLHQGELVWWSRPGGPNGRFGETARTQGRADYLADGPAVSCPSAVEAEVDRVLGRTR